MRMASSFGEDHTLEGIEESGTLRLEVVVRDAGLRCHTGHAQDVLDMLWPYNAREG